MAMAGLYVHIPFCLAKCAYCDFVSFAGLEPLYGAYVEALSLEIALVAPRWAGFSFDTLFIGGGTPTVLPTASLEAIMAACREGLHFAEDAEITVEANPGTVTPANLSALRKAGVTRLSLGVQSLRDPDLALLGRLHDRKTALEAFYWAREAGFENINLDFIFGLPGQTVSQWQKVLEEALRLRPEHLSLYALTLEEGTPLEARIRRGDLPVPNEEASAAMYELAESLLEGAGYAHYEISNWARRSPKDPPHGPPTLACRHNLKYWRNEPYLGLGAAAHSYDGAARYANVSDPAAYIARMRQGQEAVAEREAPTLAQKMGETMMLGLRLIEGISHQDFEVRFGVRLDAVYGREIGELAQEGLLEVDERGIRLTPRGRLLGNRVFAAFLP